MPSRRDIFVNRSYYHIFNKTIDHKNIFRDNHVACRFIDILSYYRSSKATLRYSMFLKLKKEPRALLQKLISQSYFHTIDIVAYCLMPNHFHLLIRQKYDDGVRVTLQKSLNALTRYYNILHVRKGPLFLTQFRSRQILTREQYIHVSRYIHLNPYSSGLVKSISALKTYPYSSLSTYLSDEPKDSLVNKTLLMNNFKNNKQLYEKFVYNHADYQKSLEYLKHMEKWI